MKNIGLIFIVLVCFVSCNQKSQHPIGSQRIQATSSTTQSKNKTQTPIDSQYELKLAIEKLQAQHNVKNYIPDDKFLFIEVISRETGEIIKTNEGECFIPFNWIDFPLYSFENSILSYVAFKPEIKYTKAILGTGLWLAEGCGSGGSTSLSDIHYFPFYKGETAIYGVDSLKTVLLRHLNIYYRVMPGESIVDSFVYVENYPNCDRIVTEKFFIHNHGLVSKENLRPW